MTRKQKRRLQKARNDMSHRKSILYHVKKRAKQRYKVNLSEEEIKLIQKIIKFKMKGKDCEEGKNICIYNLRKVKFGKQLLICYKHKFYRMVFDTNLRVVVTFIPIFDETEVCNPTIQEHIMESNRKVKEIIDNYYNTTEIVLTEEDIVFIKENNYAKQNRQNRII